MHSLVIDTDTASDDAVALMMALRHPDIEVAAITVVAGNVGIDQAVQNALYVVELSGKAVPVHAGAAVPLVQELTTAQDVHGHDGMGDIGLPVRGRTPAGGHAVDVLIDTFLARPGEIDLVTLGPLTNVALALTRAPELAGAVGHCYIMGGTGAGHGNVTPLAETTSGRIPKRPPSWCGRRCPRPSSGGTSRSRRPRSPLRRRPTCGPSAPRTRRWRWTARQ